MHGSNNHRIHTGCVPTGFVRRDHDGGGLQECVRSFPFVFSTLIMKLQAERYFNFDTTQISMIFDLTHLSLRKQNYGNIRFQNQRRLTPTIIMTSRSSKPTSPSLCPTRGLHFENLISFICKVSRFYTTIIVVRMFYSIGDRAEYWAVFEPRYACHPTAIPHSRPIAIDSPPTTTN